MTMDDLGRRPSSSEAGEVPTPDPAIMRDYIMRLTAFFMDNPAWTSLAEEARGYVGGLDHAALDEADRIMARTDKEIVAEAIREFGTEEAVKAEAERLRIKMLSAAAATIERLSAAGDAAEIDLITLVRNVQEAEIKAPHVYQWGWRAACQEIEAKITERTGGPGREHGVVRTVAPPPEVERLSAPVGGEDPEVIEAARRWVSAHEQRDLTLSGEVAMKFARAVVALSRTVDGEAVEAARRIVDAPKRGYPIGENLREDAGLVARSLLSRGDER